MSPESDMVDVLMEIMHDTYDLATVHGADTCLLQLDYARRYERDIADVIRRWSAPLGISGNRGLMTAAIEKCAWGI